MLDKLFKKKKAETTVQPASVTPPAPVVQPAPAAKQEKKRESPYLTRTVVFGMHQYRRPGEDSSVYFVDEDRDIRKMLVDSVGRIQNFPGVKDREVLEKNVEARAIEPQIRFRTSFEKREDRWIMLWEVQPDGRYWEDEDGFGGTNDEEVTLWTYVDGNGDFTGPFQIYSIGVKQYYSVPQTHYPVGKAKQLPPKFYELLDKWGKELAEILESGKATWYAKLVTTTFVFRGVHYELGLKDFCPQALIDRYNYGICSAAFEILQKTVEADMKEMGAKDVVSYGFLD